MAVAAWQWVTVQANYGGNGSALFCTGAEQPLPPLVAAEHIYVFPHSTGYDGQFYHYMAHDPGMRSGLKGYVDNPGLRYRRILIPLLAYVVALGNSDRIDGAYEAVFLFSIGLGVYWSCRFVKQAGLAVSWGLLFLLMPAIPISMDRLVLDAGLAAITAGFLFYKGSPGWQLFALLAAAALTRETGFLLVAAYVAHLGWRREFRRAGIFALSAVPAIAWYSYVNARTTGSSYGLWQVPFSSILRALRNPVNYPAETPFADGVRLADYLALTGMLLAFLLAALWIRRAPPDPVRITALLFAGMGVVLQFPDPWQNVYHFSRAYTPLLMCLAALATQYRRPWLLAPVAMILPRIAIQLTPQVLGVLSFYTGV